MVNTQKEPENKTIFTSEAGVPLTEENLKYKRFVVFTGDDGKKHIGKIVSIDSETKKAIVKTDLKGGALKDLLRGFRKTEKTEIDANKIIGVGVSGEEALKWKLVVKEETPPAQAENAKLEKGTEAAFERMKRGYESAKNSKELKDKLEEWGSIAKKSPGTDIALAYEKFIEQGYYSMAVKKIKNMEEQEWKLLDKALQNKEFTKKFHAAFMKMGMDVHGAKTSQELKKQLAEWDAHAKEYRQAYTDNPGAHPEIKAYDVFKEQGDYDIAQDKVKELEDLEEYKQDTGFAEKVYTASIDMALKVYGAKTSQELKKKLAEWKSHADKYQAAYLKNPKMYPEIEAYNDFKKQGYLDGAQERVKSLEGIEKDLK